mmetsp:Transcript_17385/g.40575  ORF Transcript_17385/g.40575 Transcript_17385/m.40575 type:complete len:157 (-) Transcript_17385:114-584(-)
MADVAIEDNLEAGNLRGSPAARRQAARINGAARQAKGIWRERVLRWLLGKDMYGQLSPLELNLVFVIFVALVFCTIFTLGHTLLNPSCCAEEHSRRLAAEEEITRLKARVRELRPQLEATTPMPFPEKVLPGQSYAEVEAGRISAIAQRLRGKAPR